jgi:hypothetical protein
MFFNPSSTCEWILIVRKSELRINPAVRWIKPKSPEENGFGSEVYICSGGKEFRCASSGNQIGGQFGPKQRGHFQVLPHSWW